MTVKSDLAALGWRVDTSDRLAQAVKDFRRGWNLGPPLTAEGDASPATLRALEVSMDRSRAGLPDFSPSFSAVEFRCPCHKHSPTGKPSADCRRIWIRRGAVQMAEHYRTLVGPYRPDRACRCPRENARVGGVEDSQHLFGNALDVPVYAVTVEEVKALRVVSGLGYYVSSTGRAFPRHIDTRHLGNNTTPGVTTTSPAVWNYGRLRGTPLTPRPTTITPQEDDMPTVSEVWAAQIGPPDNRRSVAAALAAAERNAGAALEQVESLTAKVDDDMPTVSGVWAAQIGPPDNRRSVAAALAAAERNAAAALAQVESLTAKVDELLARIPQPPPGRRNPR